jgi:hypothetical protein
MDVTIAAGKTAVRAIFVHDCVEHDLWLNPNGYVIQEHTSTKTKRNRPFLTTPAKTKSVRKVKRETRSSTPHSGSGSLSPPNEKSRQQANSGRYRYSEEEKAYFMQYVKVLFQRDPLISYNSISKKMHKKVDFVQFSSFPDHKSLTCTDASPLRESMASIHGKKGCKPGALASATGIHPCPSSPQKRRTRRVQSVKET